MILNLQYVSIRDNSTVVVIFRKRYIICTIDTFSRMRVESRSIRIPLGSRNSKSEVMDDDKEQSMLSKKFFKFLRWVIL